MPDAIIFDLDGTLYENRRLPLRLILGDLRHALTLRAERQARRALMGRDYTTEQAFREAFFAEIARRRGLDVQTVAAWYDDRYMPLMVAVLQMYYQARPCVGELLSALRRRGIRSVVFSDYGCVEAKLLALGIEPGWVDGFADAPSLGGLKPAPQVFGRMLDRFGLDPATTLMVGDRADTDGAGAAAVGMAFRNVKRRADWDALLSEYL